MIIFLFTLLKLYLFNILIFSTLGKIICFIGKNCHFVKKTAYSFHPYEEFVRLMCVYSNIKIFFIYNIYVRINYD